MRIKKFSKRINFLLVILMGLIVLSINLSAMISSRIEGVVYDKDTGKPIEGAEVLLFQKYPGSNYIRQTGITKTDNKGYFRIERQLTNKNSKFCIIVEKLGYAVYGHINTFIKKKKEEEKKGVFVNELYSNNYRNRLIGPKNKNRYFSLKEGDKKYLRIGLVKEVIIEINIGYKWLPQIGEIKNDMRYKHYICIKHSSYSYGGECFKANEHFSIRGYGEGEIKVEIMTKLIGYPVVVYKRKVKGGERVVINHVFDLTKGGVVYGKVEGHWDRDVSMHDPKWKRYYSCDVSDDGYYVIGGIKAGKYIVRAKYYYREKEKSKIIVLKENEKKEVNFSYKGEK